jgi:hypothetical protein
MSKFDKTNIMKIGHATSSLPPIITKGDIVLYWLI